MAARSHTYAVVAAIYNRQFNQVVTADAGPPASDAAVVELHRESSG